MVSQRLINYIKEDLKSHDKEEIKKILVGQGYPKELAENAVKAAVEASEQEKENIIKEENNIKKLKEEKKLREDKLKEKKEQTKESINQLKKKSVKNLKNNSKLLIFILIIILIVGGVFVFDKFSNNLVYNKNVLKIGLVTDLNGLGDKSFNDMAYKALLDSKEKYQIEFEVLEPKNEEEIKKSLRKFAKQKFDLIISIGFSSEESVDEIANEFPKIKFVIIDGVVEKPNVASLRFKEEEGAYLAGIMAGMMTKSNKIGFIGGVDIQIIRNFEAGFRKSIESVNFNANLTSVYLSSNSSGFNNSKKAKNYALELYDLGVDIIYHCAGLSGDGVIEAAKEKDKYVIGMDFNQDYMAKGNVLTSVVKRVDNLVLVLINLTDYNNFKWGIYEVGLSDNCMSLTEFEYTRDIIPKEVIEKIEETKEDIKSGKINVY